METCVVSWVRGIETHDRWWPAFQLMESGPISASSGEPSPPSQAFLCTLLGVSSMMQWAWGPPALASGQIAAGISLRVWEEAWRALTIHPALGIKREGRIIPWCGKGGQRRHPIGQWAGREGETLLSQSSASAKPAPKSNEDRYNCEDQLHRLHCLTSYLKQF